MERDQLRKSLGYVLTALCAATIVASIIPAALANGTQRTIAFFNIHTKETLRVVYKRNGRYQTDALKRINWILRDWRRDISTNMDPRVIDLAWEIHKELGSRAPIHVISGYRSPKTNAMLRRTRGGQARRSQHILGKALDMHFPDVPVWRLRYAGLIRERGGVGFYPRSSKPFVHIDTGRVRHWPRMGRYELALLFPSGKTLHVPRGGKPITRDDTVIARQRHTQLASRVAAYHDARRHGRPQTVVAALTPSLIGPFRTSVTAAIEPPRPQLAVRPPLLLQQPRRVARPNHPIQQLDISDRDALSRLAAFAAAYTPADRLADRSPRKSAVQPTPLRLPSRSEPRTIGHLIAGTDAAKLQELLRATWISSPSYDEEHPEEPPADLEPAQITKAPLDEHKQAALTHFIRSHILDDGELPRLSSLPMRRERQEARIASALVLDSSPTSMPDRFDPSKR